MNQYSRSICWLRRDLRLKDNTALFEAANASREVVPCFVYDSEILEDLKADDRRLTFIQGSVEEIAQSLISQQKALLACHGDPAVLIPSLAIALDAEAVFCSHDDDPYALERDRRVAEALSQHGKRLHSFKDHVIFERDEVVKGDGTPFKVFTPYSKAWKERLAATHLSKREPDLAKITPLSSVEEIVKAVDGARVGNHSLQDIGFTVQKLYTKPGSESAASTLSDFLKVVSGYKESRDFPALESTSRLSVHLRHGTISIRECLRETISLESPGAKKWVDELIWREFYHMILAKFPHVVDGAFQPEYDDVEWSDDEDLVQAWIDGQTGYPIVDAAMRCFANTGWMHNRLRMVAASFLTKDLLQHWKRGEAYFAETLLDFELSSNNGGWQWAAGTGVDAQPYFRIFNPILQSRKFDPEGEFIREWVPELASLSNKEIHWPHENGSGRLFGYPDPIVDHAVQREKAIALLEKAKNSKRS